MNVKKWLKIFLLLLFLFNLFFMLLYGKKTFDVENRTISNHQYDYHFALISEELDNEYWKVIKHGAVDAAKKHNVYLEYLGPKQADNYEQLKFMDKAITTKVDGLIVQGIAHPYFYQLAHKAFERGIPVVTVDTDIADSERNLFVGSDNYLAGVQAGNAVIKNTKGNQYIGIVTGRLDALNQEQRIKGFMDAVSEEKRIKVAGIEVSSITKSGAMQAAYELLKKFPYLTGFYGTSAQDGTGIAQVVNQFQIKKKIYVIGIDGLPQTMHLLETGSIDATVIQYPYEMGYQSVEAMIQLKKGNKVEPFKHTRTRVMYREDMQRLLKKGSIK